MTQYDFEMTQEEMLKNIKKNTKEENGYVYDRFRLMFERGVPFVWGAVYENFYRGSGSSWTFGEDYGQGRQFHYGGSNPDYPSNAYSIKRLRYQLIAYEYDVTYGYHSERTYANMHEFVAAHPEYNSLAPLLHKALQMDRAWENKKREVNERDVYDNFMALQQYLDDAAPLGFMTYKDDFFSGDWNDNKANFAVVPVWHQADYNVIDAYLALKEGGIRAQQLSLHRSFTLYSELGSTPKAWAPLAPYNVSFLPSFWFHAWKIQAPHVDEFGAISYD